MTVIAKRRLSKAPKEETIPVKKENTLLQNQNIRRSAVKEQASSISGRGLKVLEGLCSTGTQSIFLF